jgi:hypothetical protein
MISKSQNSNIISKKIILFFLLAKFIGIITTYYFFNIINEEIFNFKDLEDYSSISYTKPNPNIGFIFILSVLNITDSGDLSSIVAALLLSFVRDFIITYFLYKKINSFTAILFIIFISFHPYIAIYSIKFTTGIFTSFAILAVLLKIETDKFNWKYFLPISLIIILCRNFTTFIFASFALVAASNRLSTKTSIAYFFYAMLLLSFGYLISGDYIKAQTYAVGNVVSLSVDDINQFFNLTLPQNYFTENIINLFGKIVLLFGGREKYYVEGFSAISQDHILIIISLFILLFVHIFSFFILIKTLFTRSGIEAISILFPLILVIFSVSHMRYLAPYIPFMLAALSIHINNKFNRKHQS